MAKSTYGNLKFNGQQHQASFNVEAAVEEGDAVAVTATAGTLGRGSTGDEIAGIVERLEADDVATIALPGSNKIVTVPRSGALTLGWDELAVNGSGAIIAGTGTRKFFVIGTQTEDTVDYVTFIL